MFLFASIGCLYHAPWIRDKKSPLINDVLSENQADEIEY